MKIISIFLLTWLFTYSATSAQLDAIVYSGSGQLCSVSPNGTSGTCLSTRKEVSSPVWQPNGKRIVVEAGEHDGQKKLEILDSHGQKVRTLDRSVGFIRAAWSPDGRYIYAVKSSLGPALGRWDSHGKNFAQLPISGMVGSTSAQMLSFSPSGKRLAILNRSFDGIHVVRLSANGLITEKTIPSGFRYVSGNAWLDEKRLIFIGKQQDGRSSLWEMNADDGRVKSIEIPQLALRDFLALSPDKNEIVVCATKNGEKLSWSLWKYKVDGSSSPPTRLTYGQEDVSPNWIRGSNANSSPRR